MNCQALRPSSCYALTVAGQKSVVIENNTVRGAPIVR